MNDIAPISETPVSIPTRDTPLSGMLFSAHSPRAVAVVHPATGVPMAYYKHFARWLATSQNITTLIYDYRPADPDNFGARTMSDWGIHDQQAARDWVSAHAPDTPLWVIGHSLGGFMLPHQTGCENIARIIAVASGPVHVRDHPAAYQIQSRAFWYLLGPLSVLFLGHLSGRLLGSNTNIPPNVFRQWKLWCTSRGFYANDPHPDMQNFDPTGITCPIHSVAFSDDNMIPPPAAHRIATLYPNAPHTATTITPADHGLGVIGHLAAFSRRNAAIWPMIIADPT